MTLRAAGWLMPALLLMATTPTMPASLEVSPVRIEVDAPAAASTITVSNPGAEPLAAQLRVFKWTHANGKDTLSPTKDVVASPPLTQLAPGQPYVVRIIRVAKRPVAGEETYRLLVDEIPNPHTATPSMGPRFAIRQSIPVFFTEPAAAPKLFWAAHLENGRLVLEVRNDGQKRVRLSALNVTGPAGASLGFGGGFVGYVFGQSSERWAAAAQRKSFAPGSTITILAQSDNGPIKATAKIRRAD